MSFLNPIFLFALAAVGLPLVIHLLNLRKPKRVRFSTVAFFKELQKTTIRKIKLKKWLLLTLRLLAIACLAMVLARPFLPPVLSSGATQNQPAVYAILLDNSISMSRIGSKGPLLNQAKELVNKIVESSDEEDRFIIQTTNGVSINSSISTKSQIERRLEQIDISKGGAFLSERINFLASSLSESPFQNKKMYLIDDQNSELRSALNSEFDDILNRFSITMLNVEDVEVQNTFISDITTSSAMVGKGIPFSIDVRVQNASEVIAANQFLTLSIDGATVGQYSVSLNEGEAQSFSFEINPDKSGLITGFASIEGDGFIMDNEYYFSIQVPTTRNILWVQKEQINLSEISYTAAILDAQGDENSQIKYSKITPNDLSKVDISSYDALILEELDEVPEFLFSAVQNFVQEGKGLIFFPSETANIQNYNKFLSLFNAGRFVGIKGEYSSFKSIAKADNLLEDHPVFSGLFNKKSDEEINFEEPDIYYYLKLRTNSSGLGLNIIEMNNGDPLLREKKYGEGRLLIYSIGNDPSWSNFPVKALYAPSYYRSVLYASSLEDGGFSNQILGKPFEWRGNADPDKTQLVYDEETIQINPQKLGGRISLSYTGYEWEPGWVTITDGENLYKSALNLEQSESTFNLKKEIDSDTIDGINIVDAGALTAEEVANEIKTSGFGREIWQWFMMAGFLLLITESLVSIFYKAETVK